MSLLRLCSEVAPQQYRDVSGSRNVDEGNVTNWPEAVQYLKCNALLDGFFVLVCFPRFYSLGITHELLPLIVVFGHVLHERVY